MTVLVAYQLNESIATLSMDDGKVNVMSPPMLAELNGALDRAQADRATVLLTGRAGAFSAGFDMQVLTGGGEPAFNMLMNGFRLAERLLAFPQPVVVACTGHALAMGVFLLLTADYSVVADGKYKIGANEVAIGLTMPRTATEICRQRLAPAHFRRAVVTAEIYSPRDAVAAGFVDQVVPETELQAETLKAATRLSKLNRTAFTATKQLAREGTLQAVRAAVEADAATFRGMLGRSKA